MQPSILLKKAYRVHSIIPLAFVSNALRSSYLAILFAPHLRKIVDFAIQKKSLPFSYVAAFPLPPNFPLEPQFRSIPIFPFHHHQLHLLLRSCSLKPRNYFFENARMDLHVPRLLTARQAYKESLGRNNLYRPHSSPCGGHHGRKQEVC